jgi:hypothetical protein
VLQMRDVRDYSGFLASRGVKKRRMIVSLYLIKGNSKEGARVLALWRPHSSAVGYCAITVRVWGIGRV